MARSRALGSHSSARDAALNDPFPNKSAGPLGAGLSAFVAGGGSHHPAGKAGLALTGRAAPLVFAPEEEQAVAPEE
jgi:hypothetical protein